MGNIGAYIGLFLGYSALQLPDFIVLVSQHFRKYLTKRRSVMANVVTITTQLQVKEELPTAVNQLSITSDIQPIEEQKKPIKMY